VGNGKVFHHSEVRVDNLVDEVKIVSMELVEN
jgi:hypothetical protein